MRIPLLVFAVIAIGVLAQNIVMFRGGIKDGDFYRFPSMHDTMWNIALTAELVNHFPPEHPGLSGEKLKNNHYFYPLVLAIIHKLTGISMLDLYFRIGPILVSIIYGFSLYLAAKIFSRNPFFQALIIFMGYFSGSLSYVLPVFYGRSFNWQGNTFLSDQPFDQIINPYSVLGYAFMLSAVYLTTRIFDKKNTSSWKYILLFSLISGLSYGFKSFGGIIMVGALILTTAVSLFLEKKRNKVAVIFLTLLFFLPVFFLITEPDKAGLRWAPGWVLTEMMIKGDGLNIPQYAQIEGYYQSIGNLPGLFKIRFTELAIYIIGNLGIRLLGLIMLIRLVFKKRTYTNLYILFCTILSLAIPLLFNLGGNAHNIVQFTPYSLVILAVLSGVFLEKTYYRLSEKGKGFLGIMIFLIVILLAVPVNIKNIYTKLEMPNDKLAVSEMEALQFIKNHSKPDDIILIDPKQFDKDQMYVSAISERRIYLASPDYIRQTNRDPQPRTKLINDFFDSEMLGFPDYFPGNIRYLYIKKPFNNQKIRNLMQSEFIKRFESNQVIILGR